MSSRCARRPPGQGEPPLKESGVGTTEAAILADHGGELNGTRVSPASQPLPAQLIALADQIAERFVADVEARRAGGGR